MTPPVSSVLPTKVGYALGGGHAFASKLSLKAAYLYYGLGKANDAVVAANTIAEGEELDGGLARIGLDVRD